MHRLLQSSLSRSPVLYRQSSAPYSILLHEEKDTEKGSSCLSAHRYAHIPVQHCVVNRALKQEPEHPKKKNDGENEGKKAQGQTR
ncbi:hypothetical protein AFLA_000703 [Aspergillus flavus NRRL3357]|nr:hypothetical protein AFLA_000703 [Aspergillus flavus NRRL3357]